MPLVASLQEGFNARLEEAYSVAQDTPSVFDNMPSFKSIFVSGLSALGSAQTVLGRTSTNKARVLDTRASAACPSDGQLSCHNTTAVDNLCCFNAPGGSLLQTQFWDTDPVTGPVDSWTIHGLWPDNCDGTYDANCDPSRAYTNITAILQAAGDTDTLSYMQTYWKDYNGNDETFWEHEWAKHGTCISTLDPDCYTSYAPTEEVPDFFDRTVSLFKSLPSYSFLSDAGIVPSRTATYSYAAIQSALAANHDGMDVYLGCSSGALNEIWYYFNVRGSVQTGDFVPASPDNVRTTCPTTGIKYLPKDGQPAPSPTATTTRATSAPTPTNTGPPFTGKGYLNVIPAGSTTPNGCLISKGTWYTTGTCATYTATSTTCPCGNQGKGKGGGNCNSNGNGANNGNGHHTDCFTLTSSKGACAIVEGVFTCADSVEEGSIFEHGDGNVLLFEREGTWGADVVPTGQVQGTVFAEKEGHAVGVSVVWQGR